jgi:PAS domain S-box-containing protein
MITQQDFFEHIFRQHGAIMIVTDAASGRMLDANDAALAFYGYTMEAWRSLHLWDLNTLSEAELRVIWGRVESAAQRVFNFTHRLASGEQRRVEILTSPIMLDSGVALYSIVRDITESERIAQEQARLVAELARRERRLNESQRLARVGSWEWNVQTGIIEVSDELLNLLNLPASASPGPCAPFIGAVHPDDRDRAQLEALRALARGEPLSVLYRVDHPVAGEQILATRGQLVRDEEGQPQWMVGTTQDVTASKRVEDELREYARQLEANMRESEEFAYVASHDLQEPLRKIRTFGDRLRQLSWEQLDDTSRNYLERMMAAAGRMSRLIEDLLAYSRVSTRGQAMEEVEPEEPLREALETLAVSVEEAGATVEISGPLPSFEADAGQIEQLFQNLLSNALKFRRADTPSHIQISGKRTARADDEPAHVEIIIEDNGIGFDGKYAEAIFAPFHRLHGRDAYPGTGIGLAICRKIVERHHGHISATARPCHGARFTITLPEAQPPGLPKPHTGPHP